MRTEGKKRAHTGGQAAVATLGVVPVQKEVGGGGMSPIPAVGLRGSQTHAAVPASLAQALVRQWG